jgi:hypothetical protein
VEPTETGGLVGMLVAQARSLKLGGVACRFRALRGVPLALPRLPVHHQAHPVGHVEKIAHQQHQIGIVPITMRTMASQK